MRFLGQTLPNALIITLMLLLPTTVNAKIKILPLGDSITSQSCWRAYLYKHLLDTPSLPPFQFIGSSLSNATSCPRADYEWDLSHEGHPDMMATQMVLDENLPVWLRKKRPDIALVHIGTPDLLAGTEPGLVLAALDRAVEQLRARNPNIIILVAELIGIVTTPETQHWDPISPFNALVWPWANQRQTSRSPINVVDQFTGYDPWQDSLWGRSGRRERVLPDVAGDVKIAERWVGAVVDAVKLAASRGVN
ncbi:SGNH hydrolase [Ascobolus immersus RN42]|uniref:SGNH hydrolase n=1 Tax=Ascobolus immersus RN42 TaxID=1160509 RepID=A0A3N4I0P3_ASCIM|nr:SGNH hydrolase [Ascobolus immersus RN42]